MTGRGTFTDRVRQELSRAPTGPMTDIRGELGALLRVAGRFHRIGTERGSRTTLELSSSSGAVIRRAYRLVLLVAPAHPPQLRVRAPGGVRTGVTYGLAVTAGVTSLTTRLGLLDPDGHPVPGLPAALPPAIALRAALLAASSLSDPGRAVHLEFRSPSAMVSRDLAAAAAACNVTVHHDPLRERLVVKSGHDMGVLLSVAGATDAAAEAGRARERRHLRNAATRLANADAANLHRSVGAAQSQLATITQAIAKVGWTGIAEQLRPVALARLANPAASLTELGQLCDPPIGKSGVHRRLGQLAALAGDSDATDARGQRRDC